MRPGSVADFEALVAVFFGAFTAPTAQVYLTLVRGWVQCLGRPTIRRLVSVVDGAVRSLSTYARFFRTARWGIQELWRLLVVEVLAPWFPPVGRLIFAGDDTTCDKFGKRVAFAALFRDAVHSTGSRTVFHRAHCWVVLSLQVRPALWRKVVSFPVHARLYRKEADCDAEHPFRTRQQLLLEMIREVAGWLPDRAIELVGDGAYPCKELVVGLPPKVIFTSRMRSDAALYERARRPRRRRPGRPRQKGRRLPTPKRMARRVRQWKRVRVVLYGRECERLVWSRRVLWWKVSGAVPVLLVSFGKVQGWRPRTVERQAPFALFVLSSVKAWYLHRVALRERPDDLPPTSAMLTALRLAYWRERINHLSLPNPHREPKYSKLSALLFVLPPSASKSAKVHRGDTQPRSDFVRRLKR